MPERKKNRILGLVFLYLVAFSAAISGIVAYASSSEQKPASKEGSAETQYNSRATSSKNNDSPTSEPKLYSAPRDTLNLPIQLILGNDVQNNNAAASTTEQDAPTNSTTSTANIYTRTSKKSATPVTCSAIDMCNKLTFSNDISAPRKAQYTKAIFEIIQGIMSHTTRYAPVSKGLFSISITNDKGDRRGRGGSQTIQVNTKDIQTTQEFKEIVTHELGHIIDLGILVGSGISLDTSFTLNNKPQFNTTDPSLAFYSISWLDSTTRRSNASYTDFVGGYAMTSPYEDFAESWNMFLWHNTTFRVMAKDSPQLMAKYQFFASILGTFSFAKDVQNAKKVIGQPSRRPRDTSTISTP